MSQSNPLSLLVGHLSALFDADKDNCPTFRGGHGSVGLFEYEDFPGSEQGTRFAFVGETR